ncbi:MAG TPA: nickel pincer cofactor biosynthesis protein LarC [Gemmatimonadales bacterium]
MSDRRFAIIDPAAGVSGDMLLGALIAVGADPAWLHELPSRLGLDGVSVEIDPADRCGIACTKVTVRLPDGSWEAPADTGPHQAGPAQDHDHHHHHEHGHAHHHDPGQGHHQGPHRRVGELIARIQQAGLSDWVRDRALRAIRMLGEAEGRVHGVPAEDVTLHEVGAWDALVDIVGAVEGFERLGIHEIRTRPVALGEGWVRAAHGVLPVPAPATAILLEGLPIGPNGPVRGEATTPTGAALLQALSNGPAPTHWRAERSGWGAGSRNPGGYPNALRIVLAETAEEAGEVSVLAVDLDDMSPEYLEPLRDALVGAGAIDVQTWTTQAKKGRVGFRVEAVVPRGREAAVADAMFANSTTAGVRWTRAERATLPRHQTRYRTPEGAEVRVKVLQTAAGPRLKPEFDDVTQLARATGRPALDVAADVRTAAERLVSVPGTSESNEPKELT